MELQQKQKRDDKKISKLLRKRRWNQAVVAAIECAASEMGDPYLPGRTVKEVALAAREDDGALDTLLRIIRQEFQDCGPAGISGPIEMYATDGVDIIGRRAVPRLLPLLTDDRPEVAANAMRGLGIADDVSVLPRIAEIHAQTAASQLADSKSDLWRSEMRQSSYVACLNLFDSDPEGYAKQAMEMGPQAREMLASAAGYVASQAGVPTTDEARRRYELADMLRGRMPVAAAETPKAPVDPGATKLSIALDQAELHQGDLVAGRIRLRSRRDRGVCVPDAPLSIVVDGMPRQTITTNSRGEASLSLEIQTAGHHKIKIVYQGGGHHDGLVFSGTEQVYGFDVKA